MDEWKNKLKGIKTTKKYHINIIHIRSCVII